MRNAPVIQIWLGDKLPDRKIVSMMKKVREQAVSYYLITGEASPLLTTLSPDVSVVDKILIAGIRNEYQNVAGYLDRFGREPREVSSILRFKALSIHPSHLYVDVDATIPDVDLRHYPAPTFGRYQSTADTHVIWNAEDPDFFRTCLLALGIIRGPFGLEGMVRNHPHRFPVGSYTHLARKGIYASV